MSVPVLSAELVLQTGCQPFSDRPADGAVKSLTDLSRCAGDAEVFVEDVAVDFQGASEVRRNVVTAERKIEMVSIEQELNLLEDASQSFRIRSLEYSV